MSVPSLNQALQRIEASPTTAMSGFRFGFAASEEVLDAALMRIESALA